MIVDQDLSKTKSVLLFAWTHRSSYLRKWSNVDEATHNSYHRIANFQNQLICSIETAFEIFTVCYVTQMFDTWKAGDWATLGKI